MGAVAPRQKLFSNWTKISLRMTHDWRIKFKRANEKHSSEQVLHFPINNSWHIPRCHYGIALTESHTFIGWTNKKVTC